MENFDQRNYTTSPSYPGPAQGGQPTQIIKHSGPGIASFIISLVAFMGYLFSTVLVSVAAANVLGSPEELFEEYFIQQGSAVAGVLLLFITVVLNLTSLVLGIVGISMKNRKKVFAILGTIFSAIPILPVIFVLLFAFL
ncbi:hypothetical protein M3201_03760 [Paenibacillus motobuensis]|uniref:hypothetical protein n=1 Tax=Paenibacillus TaxID=44249 RepID=UPI002041E680|nr:MULTISPECIES: hypothetical protein [Paenibacillus]MCM3038816.1 hypothetical protein [Paenibacillus lutimineralis]MCM3645920.1 hypothetical protein [Paenibacillus motobuensis]